MGLKQSNEQESETDYESMIQFQKDVLIWSNEVLINWYCQHAPKSNPFDPSDNGAEKLVRLAHCELFIKNRLPERQHESIKNYIVKRINERET